MSVSDPDGREIIRLDTLRKWAFDLLLLGVPAGFSLLSAASLWVVNRVLDHDKEMAVMKSNVTQLQKLNGVAIHSTHEETIAAKISSEEVDR